jgi:hypothetical protein
MGEPDRFDGCDLSRVFGAASLADIPMMVIFALAGKRRFPRRNRAWDSGLGPRLGAANRGTADRLFGQSIELHQALKKRFHLLER